MKIVWVAHVTNEYVQQKNEKKYTTVKLFRDTVSKIQIIVMNVVNRYYRSRERWDSYDQIVDNKTWVLLG